MSLKEMRETAIEYGYILSPHAEAINNALEANRQSYGARYCPCRVDKTTDNICPCKPFRENGDCVCKLYLPQELPFVQLVHITPNSTELMCEVVGGCYQNKIGPKTLEKIIKSGHLSVLEHAHATFRLRVSTAVLAQITRHRHFSFMVQSSRGCKLTDVMIPEGVKDVEVFTERVQRQMSEYNDALLRGESFEDAAYLLPKAAVVEVYITGNLRTFYEFLPKRLCGRANKEIRVVAEKIADILDVVQPLASNDKNCNTCTEVFGCSFSK